MTPLDRTVLILGRRHSVVDGAERQLELELPGTHVHEGISIEDARAAFAQTNIDHVIMGAGIELEDRLQIVREVFQTSDTTSVHMKDRASGPDGFLPFIRAVLRGLQEQPSS